MGVMSRRVMPSCGTMHLNIASMIGDALNSLKNRLTDPAGVLQSWDSTLVNPSSRTCTLHWIGVRKRVGQCLCPLVKFNRSKSLNILPKIRQKIRMYPVLLQEC
ncbi:hypothetical protein Ahy_A02g007968 [Arachis hypogaea]|uniref:Leucine-rich repeat-containing N-terminal plant-type domain-containing protein n=1 Tax=Arachis hypogaea TaxID=3818 RepID=A0A445EDS6_ARAHY|nr:hypothetical protein Ahy_A02g007968 [Arachis hypogaea]